MDGITIITCYAIMIVGQVADLDSLARLIVSTVKDVEVLLVRHSSGWRLQLICRDQATLNACSTLIRDRVVRGMPITVSSGKSPLETRIYSVSP